MAAWALVGHILEVVNAAGDASAGPEANDAESPCNQPGEEAHLGLGDGGDVRLAVGTCHFGRRGSEGRHDVDMNWMLDRDLTWRSLHMLSILLGRCHRCHGCHGCHWCHGCLRFLDSHSSNLSLKKSAFTIRVN